ncbi:MAG TPA: SIS domain-containing protein, partial [Anaerolineaceae bacterium]|nr:SIS domain-containing protein [Anaerolineaceae bacterium]
MRLTKAQAAEIKSITAQYEQVIFTGCGSTYYLSLAGAALYQSMTGKTARAVPASELLLNGSTVLSPGTRYLLIAVSRSGTTTETLRAIEKYQREQWGGVIVINNYETEMTRLGDVRIVIPAGQEESVAQTRSFASMYVAVTALCAIASARDDLLQSMAALPAAGARLMDQYE